MPDFTYVARDLTGKKISGSMSAATERDVVQHLGTQELFPIEVKGGDGAAGGKRSFSLGGGISAQVMSDFYAQMASLLRNGVPLLRALKLITMQTSSSALKAALEDVTLRVEDGEAVGDAFAKHPKVFHSIATNMARAGAEGGFLEDALERVSEFTEQQADLKARTMGALIYPIVLSVIGTAIVLVLLIFFVPKFDELFETLRAKGQLPWATEALLSFSRFMQSYGIVFLGIVAILYVGWRVYLTTEPGKRLRDLVRIKVPLFGKISKNLSIARFCRVLGTLLKNGVPILKSLEISSQASGNLILSEAIDKAAENISAGESLAVPLGKSGHFPLTVTEMISVAEESNAMDTVLVNVADGLEKRTARKLELMVRLLEPFMLVVMAGIVLFIVMALLVPIMNMSSMVG